MIYSLVLCLERSIPPTLGNLVNTHCGLPQLFVCFIPATYLRCESKEGSCLLTIILETFMRTFLPAFDVLPFLCTCDEVCPRCIGRGLLLSWFPKVYSLLLLSGVWQTLTLCWQFLGFFSCSSVRTWEGAIWPTSEIKATFLSCWSWPRPL